MSNAPFFVNPHLPALPVPTHPSQLGPPVYVREQGANGNAYVVYPTLSNDGELAAFDAQTGEHYTTLIAGPGGSVSGPSVVNGILYAGKWKWVLPEPFEDSLAAVLCCVLSLPAVTWAVLRS